MIGACSSGGDDTEEDDAGFEGGSSDDGTFDASSERDARPRRDTGPDVADGMADADAGRRPDADAGDGSRDSGPKDAFAETGSACSPLNTTQTAKCGYCGQMQRVCLDPADSGALTWQEWGACVHEVDGGCMPGETRDAGCGKCGTMALTCTNSCQWPTSGSCKNQGPCWPGDIDFNVALSCDAGTGRERACDNTCTWSAFGACEAARGNTVTIPSTAGGRIAEQFTLSPLPSRLGAPDTYGCPTYFYEYYEYSDIYPYTFVELHNPDPTDATVSVWTYAAPTNAPSSGTIFLYAYDHLPTDDDTSTWESCIGTVSECCHDMTTEPSAACVADSWCSASPSYGGLMKGDGNALTIPANSSIWLYINQRWEYPYVEHNVMVGVKRH